MRSRLVYTQCNGVERYYSQHSVMTREYKYVTNGFDNDELFDLRNDPLEMTNLAKDPAYDEIKHDLVQRMWRFAAAQNDELIMNPYYAVALAPWGPGMRWAGETEEVWDGGVEKVK